MNRIHRRLSDLQMKGRKALSLFITAGYPTLDATVPLALECARNGADLIEIGIPFSDPIADGPVIQMSSEIALRNGISLKIIFGMVETIRAECDLPIILMGYANPVFSYGLSSFMTSCSQTGVDGVIIPDLPPEESSDYERAARENDLATIFLAAPTTPNERLGMLDAHSTGFLYCVSITGVTGERKGLSEQTVDFLKRVRTCVKQNPVLVGFGIATPDDARRVSSMSDGIIVGSALISHLSSDGQEPDLRKVGNFIRGMRNALDEENPV